MTTKDIPEFEVPVDRLRVGVHIRLDGVPWHSHPFFFSSFKIKSMEQIETLRDAGIETVICVPRKSDKLPLKEARREDRKSPKRAKATDHASLWERKQERIKNLAVKRERIAHTEKNYTTSIKQVGSMMFDISKGRPGCMKEAIQFVDGLAERLLPDSDATIHLMNLSRTDENIYYHSLNVSVLSMMLASKMGLGKEELSLVGLGGLFHDVGKAKIEKRVVSKRGQLNKAEKELLRLHPRFGVEILSKIEGFPPRAMRTVYQHHERCDRRGYPQRLGMTETDILARIVSITDVYDNLCNRIEPETSLTPYQALAFMFSKLTARFDPEALATFIHLLGIYPPGTVVKLSNGDIGIVVSVNAKNPLQPSVVLYDPTVPKSEALIVSLAEEIDLEVAASLHPSNLPDEIYQYLSATSNISYFVEEKEGHPAKVK